MSDNPSFPAELPIEPLTHSPDVTMRVPGSKSITNRALILAALASRQGDCTLEGVLECEDTHVMIESLNHLGFHLKVSLEADDVLHVQQLQGDHLIAATKANLFVENSGTSMRFLTALVSLGEGLYHLDGIDRMRERPIEDLLQALQQLGVDAKSIPGNGCPPVMVQSKGMKGGHVQMRGDVSSQFLSGLLMAAPLAQNDVTVEIDGTLVSRPYVDMTLQMIQHFGGVVEEKSESCFLIPGNQKYQCDHFVIEPDASSASYFFAAAAITQGKTHIEGLGTNSLQGDVAFVDLLEKMGCEVIREESAITVVGHPLSGIDADLGDISDTVMTLAAVACFAEGPTNIRNVAHVRHKETDRLHALTQELRRVGIEVEERGDGLTITPQPMTGTLVQTYNDHRMAMSLSLLGLRVPGMVIHDPGCVTKTYPHFFEDFGKLREPV